MIMVIFQLSFMPMPISNAGVLEDIFESGDKFLDQGKVSGSEVLNQTELKIGVNNIYNVLFALGVALSVLVGAILGIKFMMGSIEEQAKIKEALIPYVFGCIVVFGAFGIWKLVMTLGGNIFN